MRISDWSSDVCSSDLLKADEAQLRASYDQAEANRQRALSLQASGGVSDQDVLQYVTQARTAAAALAAKRLQLRYTSVVAPDDGVISARTATLGAVAPAGQEFFRLIRSEEHTSELQSLMRISYAVFCLQKKNSTNMINQTTYI